MLRSQDHERGPEQRVRPGREHAKLVTARLMVIGRGREHDLGALGPADPVRLLDSDRLRPVDPAEVEQLVGILRDPEEPLLEVALLDEGTAPPAASIRPNDLLPRERAVVRAPVDRGHRPVSQPRLEELQEDPLVPAVELGRRGDDLRRPLECCAHRAELRPHRLEVLRGPLGRVDAVLDRRTLGRQPERVEPHREEDVVAVHPAEPPDRVGRGGDVPVADMQIARRIGVHRQ